jgi:hypothetical protein
MMHHLLDLNVILGVFVIQSYYFSLVYIGIIVKKIVRKRGENLLKQKK